MTEQQYNAMLDAVEAIPLPQPFTDWKLTPDEVKVLRDIPNSLLSTIEKTLEAYTPQSGLDLRSTLALKGLALLLMNRRGMIQAMMIGYQAAGKMCTFSSYKRSSRSSRMP